jgi:SpoVK/Ycf46/Vps4 family AAA+-type ATPase
MARADLLLKLVKAGSVGDKRLFTKVVESLIAEERNKQHHIVADQLADILKNQQFSKDQNSNFVPKTLLDEKLESFLFRIYPNKSLDDIVLRRENRLIIDEMVQEHHRSDLLRSYNLEPRNRVLLAGAPGNGKTSFLCD